MADPLVIVEKQSFARAWQVACEEVMKNGEEFIFGGKIKGKNQIEKKTAKELEVTIKLEGNALREAIAGMLHSSFPTKEKHKAVYIAEWDRGYDWKKQGFDYNYENRCEAYIGFFVDIESYEDMGWREKRMFKEIIIDQWKLALEDLINQIDTGVQSNRNVITIGNPSIDRFEIPDSPPCLREIWLRWDRKNGVDIKTTWRSRDLYGALMTNIIALLSAVIREIIVPLTIKYGKTYKISSYSDNSKSLHIYKGDWNDALKIEKVRISPQIM